jgi:hypothetical protein
MFGDIDAKVGVSDFSGVRHGGMDLKIRNCTPWYCKPWPIFECESGALPRENDSLKPADSLWLFMAIDDSRRPAKRVLDRIPAAKVWMFV